MARTGAVGDSADGAEITEENLRLAMREAAKYGVSLEMIHMEIPRGIILADASRDEGIATVCRWIEAAGRAGLRGLNYNFVLQTEGQRTTSARGRGGTSLSTFVLDPVQNAELTALGKFKRAARGRGGPVSCAPRPCDRDCSPGLMWRTSRSFHIRCMGRPV